MKKIKKISSYGKYFVFSEKGKQGVAKKKFLCSSEVRIPAKVDKAEVAFAFGKAIFKITNGARCGLYDVENRCSFLPVLYRTIDFGWEDRAIVSFGQNNYRVIDYKTNEKIKSSDFIFPFSYMREKCFAVLRKQKYGILGLDGKEIKSFSYDDLQVYLSRYLVYSLNGEYVLCRLESGEELYRTNEEIEFEDYYFYVRDKKIVYKDAEKEYDALLAEAFVQSMRDRSL